MSHGEAVEIVAKVADTLDHAADALRALSLAHEGNKFKEDAQRLREIVTTPLSEMPRLTVVGENDKGKSTLVNGLLGCLGCSPVGYGTVTGSPILFEHSVLPTASIEYFDRQQETVEPGVARQLATVIENPGNHLNIRCVHIGVESEILDYLEFDRHSWSRGP